MDVEATNAAIATAIEVASEEEADGMVVNVDAFTSVLREAGVSLKVTDRSKLVQEVGLLREEISSVRARAFNAKGTEKEAGLEARAEFLIGRERQLIAQLWPGGMES